MGIIWVLSTLSFKSQDDLLVKMFLNLDTFGKQFNSENLETNFGFMIFATSGRSSYQDKPWSGPWVISHAILGKNKQY